MARNIFFIQIAILRFHIKGKVYLSANEIFLYWKDKHYVLMDGELCLYCYYYF